MSARSGKLMKLITQHLTTSKKFDGNVGRLKIVSLNDGNYAGEFTVTDKDVNKNGEIHNGLITTLVDVTSYYSILSYKIGYGGLSTNIHVSFIQPALLGDVLSINSKLTRLEEPLAFIDVEISKTKDSKEVVAHGQHTMFVKPYIQSEDSSQ